MSRANLPEEVHSHFTTVSRVEDLSPYWRNLIYFSEIVRAPRGKTYFEYASAPIGYQNPKAGDKIRLELRLERKRGYKIDRWRREKYKRRVWQRFIVGWPSLEREFIHEQIGYDS
jgi:hypothetical protein